MSPSFVLIEDTEIMVVPFGMKKVANSMVIYNFFPLNSYIERIYPHNEHLTSTMTIALTVVMTLFEKYFEKPPFPQADW
jgi:hypothetical protein